MELYIHIPFCKQKCRYCSFASYSGKESSFQTYIEELLIEAEFRKKEQSEPIVSVFIGGGTPSLLPPELLRKLIRGLKQVYTIADSAEFSVEANPGTVTEEWIKTAAKNGVNRISFGVQAYQESLLRILGRIHTFEDVCQSFRIAADYGISNINLDLIFGIPFQNMDMWKETLEHSVQLHPTHISTYGLIPEENTPLFNDLSSGKYHLPNPDEERDMYDYAIEFLAGHGFIQYEISNFAQKKYECKHNIGYWTQAPYLGLGISAATMSAAEFSQEGMTYLRRTNPSTLQEYNLMINDPENHFSSEHISPSEARFETMMLSLRMNEGISDDRFYHMHGRTIQECYGQQMKQLIKNGLIIHQDGFWYLTRRGFDIQNAVLVELMNDSK